MASIRDLCNKEDDDPTHPVAHPYPPRHYHPHQRHPGQYYQQPEYPPGPRDPNYPPPPHQQQQQQQQQYSQRPPPTTPPSGHPSHYPPHHLHAHPQHPSHHSYYAHPSDRGNSNWPQQHPHHHQHLPPPSPHSYPPSPHSYPPRPQHPAPRFHPQPYESQHHRSYSSPHHHAYPPPERNQKTLIKTEPETVPSQRRHPIPLSTTTSSSSSSPSTSEPHGPKKERVLPRQDMDRQQEERHQVRSSPPGPSALTAVIKASPSEVAVPSSFVAPTPLGELPRLFRQAKIKIVQQPLHARMCGFGEKDRRPIDPPPIVQLIMEDPTYNQLRMPPRRRKNANNRKASVKSLMMKGPPPRTPKKKTVVSEEESGSDKDEKDELEEEESEHLDTDQDHEESEEGDNSEGDPDSTSNSATKTSASQSATRSSPTRRLTRKRPGSFVLPNGQSELESASMDSKTKKGWSSPPLTKRHGRASRSLTSAGTSSNNRHGPDDSDNQDQKQKQEHTIHHQEDIQIETSNPKPKTRSGSTSNTNIALSKSKKPVNVEGEDPLFVLHVSLWSHDGTEVRSMIATPGHEPLKLTRILMGSVVISPTLLNNAEGVPGWYFTFSDLSIRTEGVYTLKFSLMSLGSFDFYPDAAGQTSTLITEATSDPFTVFSAKKFPGMTESTELSKVFAKQGFKIPIRNDLRPRKSDKQEMADS